MEDGDLYDAVPTTAIIPQARVVDLNALGYVERSSRRRRRHRLQAERFRPNGDWGVSVEKKSVSWTTRLLARYATDSTNTSGQARCMLKSL